MDSRSANDAPPTSPNRPELSDREREILILVATGASNKLIAQQLVISPNTVKVHLRNIFAKISVTSRTEAALYAIREGLVQVSGELPAVAADDEAGAPAAEAVTLTAEAPAEVSPPAEAAVAAPVAAPVPHGRPRWWLWLVVALAAVGLVVLSVWAGSAFRPQPTAPAPTVVPPTQLPRWIERAPLPAARAGLAVATYENQVYAIGGEGAGGVSSAVERYDPATDQWVTLTAKPLAVADVEAAVIGGRIYVPGGRLADGGVTDVLEVYDPRADAWETRAALPQALSAYALVAFEGHLYLFGGWDGDGYTNIVLEYSPDQDAWTERAAMPTARGFSGAAEANGRIYVLGGADATGPLAANEEYVPEQDAGGGMAWHARAPLPEARWQMGVVSVANIIHLVGGQGGEQPMVPLEYFPQADEWKAFETPRGPAWVGLGLAVVETVLHGVGGRAPETYTAQHQSYQAIYTVSIPVVP